MMKHRIRHGSKHQSQYQHANRMESLVMWGCEHMTSWKWLVFYAAWESVYINGRGREQNFAIDNGIVFG